MFEEAAKVIHHRGGVGIGMGIDSADDLGSCMSTMVEPPFCGSKRTSTQQPVGRTAQ